MDEQGKAKNYFLLSWTLTLSKFGNVNPFGGNIVDLAGEANQWLPTMLFKKGQVNANRFPNIIYTDNGKGDGQPGRETIPTQTTAVLSVAVNDKIRR